MASRLLLVFIGAWISLGLRLLVLPEILLSLGKDIEREEEVAEVFTPRL